MAVKWAVANGSWTTGATWNDGVVPAIGDEVYLNGHNVNANTSINIGNGTISNDANSDLGIVSGGAFVLSAQNLSHSANFQSSIGRIITLNQAGCVITGNLTGGSGSKGFIYQNTTSVGVCNITINGNISLSAGYLTETYPVTTLTVTINGSFESSTETSFYSSYTSNVNVLYLYGRIIIRGNLTNRPITSLTISGEFDGYANSQTITTFTMLSGTEPSVCTMHNSARLACTTMNVSGILRYDSSLYNTLGYTWTTLNITDNTKFGWVDIADDESRLNPFRIITNGNFDYPSPANVKKDVPYAWGELVGQYLPDYPPESVVLKDYVYDNGERIGTLENEVTINVGCTNPQDVRKDIPLANMGVVGTMVIPNASDVLEGVIFDNGTEGTLESQSTADYPAEDKVLIGISYDHDNMTGTLEPGGDNPQESDVRFGVPYNHNLNTGKAHIPASTDVREGVPVDQIVGQIVIPKTSEVKKDVEFDIDSIGTMESVIETNNTINIYIEKSNLRWSLVKYQ